MSDHHNHALSRRPKKSIITMLTSIADGPADGKSIYWDIDPGPIPEEQVASPRRRKEVDFLLPLVVMDDSNLINLSSPDSGADDIDGQQ